MFNATSGVNDAKLCIDFAIISGINCVIVSCLSFYTVISSMGWVYLWSVNCVDYRPAGISLHLQFSPKVSGKS